jgi:DNA-binding CsgD family transcriptional regulator
MAAPGRPRRSGAGSHREPAAGLSALRHPPEVLDLDVLDSAQRGHFPATQERTQTRHLVPAGEEVLQNVCALDASADGEDVAFPYAEIQQLDDLDRALLLLYLDGLSHQEISEVLGITRTNIATKIARLKDRLRKEICAAGHL